MGKSEKMIHDLLEEYEGGCSAPRPGVAGDGQDDLDVLSFCLEASRALRQGEEPDLATAMRLARKVEIARRIFPSYRKSDFRPVPSVAALDRHVLSFLMVVMIGCFWHSGDLRYVNAVLKADMVGIEIPGDYQIEREIMHAANAAVSDFFHD